MHSFTEKPKTTHKVNTAKLGEQTSQSFGNSHDENSILQMRSTIGNQAVQRLLEVNDPLSFTNTSINSGLSNHSKKQAGAALAISAPQDIHEQEADRVANKIMSMSSLSENVESTLPDMHQSTSGIEGKSTFVGFSSLGSGSPLPTTERKFMESRFGHNFAAVRVHTNSQANAMANNIDARAFTLGNNIVFGDGERTEDRRLLAHELTHVIQNRGGERHGMIKSADPNIIKRQERQESLQREGAQQAIFRFNQLTLRYIEANRRWISANYIDFLRRTGGNPGLSWSNQQVHRVLQSSITSLPSSVLFRESIRSAGTWTAETLGAVLGTEFAPGVGTAIGYLIGRVVSTASSAIYEAITGRSSSDERAHNVRMSLGEQIEAQERSISQSTQTALIDHATLISIIQRRLNRATNQQVINAIEGWLNHELSAIQFPDVNDRSFFGCLLHDWVLEHAGDEEDANRQTSEVEWEAARTEVFGEGDSLDNHPEIFAYQTRGHFQRVGLDITAANSMVEDAETLANASVAMNTYDGRSFHFDRAVNSSRFFNVLSFWAVRHNKLLSFNADRYLTRGGVDISVNLDLTTADGACYVNEWEYEVSFPVSVFRPQPSDHSVFAGYSHSIEFEESPD